ncbi:hypothetical protein PPACK8108_LOCUS25326 [Phakopsora pachyrhizi]|uniref:Uncharacterized protein n=1 Tax=Phakopsora pachyrhizi TaxID=170000 RepID=A0AAV0BVF7_PHAPC|nr:hypothetical protein PPACK8108_LOCUS25326 [Phakopsora pachyrhizi]
MTARSKDDLLANMTEMEINQVTNPGHVPYDSGCEIEKSDVIKVHRGFIETAIKSQGGDKVIGSTIERLIGNFRSPDAVQGSHRVLPQHPETSIGDLFAADKIYFEKERTGNGNYNQCSICNLLTIQTLEKFTVLSNCMYALISDHLTIRKLQPDRVNLSSLKFNLLMKEIIFIRQEVDGKVGLCHRSSTPHWHQALQTKRARPIESTDEDRSELESGTERCVRPLAIEEFFTQSDTELVLDFDRLFDRTTAVEWPGMTSNLESSGMALITVNSQGDQDQGRRHQTQRTLLMRVKRDNETASGWMRMGEFESDIVVVTGHLVTRRTHLNHAKKDIPSPILFQNSSSFYQEATYPSLLASESSESSSPLISPNDCNGKKTQIARSFIVDIICTAQQPENQHLDHQSIPRDIRTILKKLEILPESGVDKRITPQIPSHGNNHQQAIPQEPSSVFVTQPFKHWLGWFLKNNDIEKSISAWTSKLEFSTPSEVYDIQQGNAWKKMKWPSDVNSKNPLRLLASRSQLGVTTINHILKTVTDDLLGLELGHLINTQSYPQGREVFVQMLPLLGDVLKLSVPRTKEETLAASLAWKNSTTLSKREALVKESGVRWSELNRLGYRNPVEDNPLGLMHNWLEEVNPQKRKRGQEDHDNQRKRLRKSNDDICENEEEEEDEDDIDECDGASSDGNSNVWGLDGLLTVEQIDEFKKVQAEVVLPTGLERPPHPFGEQRAGKWKAHHWYTLFQFIVPVVLPQIFAKNPPALKVKSTSFLLLTNVGALCRCTSVVCARTLTPQDPDIFRVYYERYTSTSKRLFKDPNIRPNHHYALHIPEQLELWGPLHGVAEFAGERLIGFLQKIKTNTIIRKCVYENGSLHL